SVESILQKGAGFAAGLPQRRISVVAGGGIHVRFLPDSLTKPRLNCNIRAARTKGPASCRPLNFLKAASTTFPNRRKPVQTRTSSFRSRGAKQQKKGQRMSAA